MKIGCEYSYTSNAAWQFKETYDVTSYPSGWKKDVVNLCVEFEPHYALQPQLVASRVVLRFSACTPRDKPHYALQSLLVASCGQLRCVEVPSMHIPRYATLLCNPRLWQRAVSHVCMCV